MKLKSVFIAIGCIILPVMVGIISGYVTSSDVTGPWFKGLAKPFFNPPNWVFGPVWSLLYILMGVSLYLIVKSPPSQWRTWGITIFAIQLVLNFFWSIIFFRYHMLGLAVADILLLLIAIVAMITVFIKIKPIAGWLQIPYICWVCFASALTISIFYLNSGISQ